MGYDLPCKCQKYGITPSISPCERVFSNGSTHVGFWCRTCGTWRAVPRSEFSHTSRDRYVEERSDEFRRTISTQTQQAFEEEHKKKANDFQKWYENYLASPQWRQVRAKVIDRDVVCQGCRGCPPTQVHHLTYVRVGCELLTDLVALCDRCHMLEHSHNYLQCWCSRCADVRNGDAPSVSVELSDVVVVEGVSLCRH
jgi:hypothetical protein